MYCYLYSCLVYSVSLSVFSFLSLIMLLLPHGAKKDARKKN